MIDGPSGVKRWLPMPAGLKDQTALLQVVCDPTSTQRAASCRADGDGALSRRRGHGVGAQHRLW